MDGPPDLATTQLYLAFKPQRGAARRISEAFQGRDREQGGGRSLRRDADVSTVPAA